MAGQVSSLPPLEALCLYGGEPVEKWLSSAGLERTDYDRAATLADGVAQAVLGGWHAMWPDDDFYIPREMRLVLWTLWDSEPWIEVFERFPNFSVRVRIT